MPDFATGLPDRTNFGDPTSLKAGDLVPFFVQEHNANRAKFHEDWRIGDKAQGLYSWAVRKGTPEPGQKYLANQTAKHRLSYGPFEGTLKGYGAGTVKSKVRGKVLITGSDEDGLSFVTADTRFPERYRLQRLKTTGKWLLFNTTPTASTEDKKTKFKVVSESEVKDFFTPDNIVQIKLDGAANLTKILNKKLESLSFRNQKDTGRPILYSEKLGLIGDKKYVQNIPDKTVLRGEVMGYREGGESIPAAELGGLLNATIERSLQEQRRRKIKLKNMLFDVLQYRGKDLSNMPYEKRYALLQTLSKNLPQEEFGLIEGTDQPAEQETLYNEVMSGEHPETSEGVVIHPKDGGVPIKVKAYPERDVVIAGVFSGKGKYAKSSGGFTYALPEDPETVVGQIGGGLTDDDRQDLADHPEEWIGRTARVKYQEQFPSGALRAPIFLARHEDITQKTAADPSETIKDKPLTYAPGKSPNPITKVYNGPVYIDNKAGEEARRKASNQLLATAYAGYKSAKTPADKKAQLDYFKKLQKYYGM